MFYKIVYTEKFKLQAEKEISEKDYQSLLKEYHPTNCQILPVSDFNIFSNFTPE